MTTIAQLVVQLIGDVSGYSKSLESAKGMTNSFSASAISGLSAVGGTIVAGGFAAAGIAAAGMGAGLLYATKQAMEMEDATADLRATLQSTNGIAGVSEEMALKLATGFQKTTKFTDDAVLSGENMLLTFTNIGKDIFPMATEAMLNMATKMGTDAPQAAIQLGKALNNPVEGMSALRRVGVAFTDEQVAMVEEMVKNGDLMGAQGVILKELETEFGGLAVAAGSTASGKLAILKNTVDDLFETVGGALLPALSSLGNMLATELNKPEVQAFIANLAVQIGNFANQVIIWIPQVVAWFQQAFGWLQQNQGVIVAALAVIGVAIAAFVYTTVIPAAIAMLTAIAPVLLVMAAVAAIAYLVYTAWTQNWGGIQQIVGAAIASITAWWNDTLMPAIQAGISWFQTVLLPVIMTIANFIGAVLVTAISVLSAIWTNVLLPALTIVWNFLTTSVFPLFVAIGQLLGAVVGLAVRVLAGLWQNVLLPAIMTVGNWLAEKLTPIFKSLGEWINNTLIPTIKTLGGWLSDALTPAFKGISDAISKVVEWIQKMIDKIKNIKLPDWLTPGSPTPFEIGLLGIHEALKKVASEGLPQLNASLAMNMAAPSLAPAGVTGGTTGANYGGNTFYITGNDPEEIAREIGRLLKLQGVH